MFAGQEGDVMKATLACVLASSALWVAGGGAALAADKVSQIDSGEHEFRNSCALCHGTDGRGHTAILKTAPPDLTTLATRNHGVFPVDRIYAVIDGRDEVRAHGSREMPAWGDRYTAESGAAAKAARRGDVTLEQLAGAYGLDEMRARVRILSLVDYLNRIQVR
jgi:mono/diheme cytochrome c family protein